jgi:hypothetical protein
MVWRIIIGIGISALIAIGGWTANRAVNSTPREIFDKHCAENELQFNTMQNRIEDKLDKLQNTILRLHGDGV